MELELTNVGGLQPVPLLIDSSAIKSVTVDLSSVNHYTLIVMDNGVMYLVQESVERVRELAGWLTERD